MTRNSILCCFVALLLILLSCAPAGAVTNLTLSPTSSPADAPCHLVIQADTASPDNTLRVEVVADTNGNGSADAGERSVIRYTVTDGVSSPSIGGKVNWNVPGDEDGAANGFIRTTLRLLSPPFPVGRFVVRATDQDATSAQAPFQFTGTTTTYTISGQVTCSGQPVPGVFVSVMELPSECEAAAAMTDVNGNYSVYVEGPGEYLAAVEAQGYISKWTEGAPSSVSWAVVTASAPGASGVDLQLFAGTRRISGTIRDAATGAGIAGVEVGGEMETEDAEYESYVMTDWDGSFSIPVFDGEWKLEAWNLYKKGYVNLEDMGTQTVSGADLSGVDGSFPRATALIYGTVKDEHGQPLWGEELVECGALIGGTNHHVRSDVDESGNYVLGVIPGSWWVKLDMGEICRPDLGPPPFQYADIASAGQTVSRDFVAYYGGTVEGLVTVEGTGEPVAYCSVYFWGGDDPCAGEWRTSVETDDQGFFKAFLAPGNYHVSAGPWPWEGCPELAYEYWKPGGSTPFCDLAGVVAVTAGQTTGGVNFSLDPAGGISGTVKDKHDNPLEGIWVSAIIPEGGDACSGTILSGALTDTQGHYMICGLPAGTYALRAYGGSLRYIDEYYDDVGESECSLADIVPVTAGGMAADIDFFLTYWFQGDFDRDGDVDGRDLLEKATGGGTEVSLERFAENFGKRD